MVSVLYSFVRSVEMPGKRDSFGRSAGQIFGENGSPVPVAMVSVLYSFGRSVEMTGKRDSFGRSVEMTGKRDSFGRSAENIYGESGFRRGSCDLGVFLLIFIYFSQR